MRKELQEAIDELVAANVIRVECGRYYPVPFTQWNHELLAADPALHQALIDMGLGHIDGPQI